jgi:hypothetical protein
MQKLFSLIHSHLFILSLHAEFFEFYLGIHSLYLYVPGYFQLVPRILV